MWNKLQNINMGNYNVHTQRSFPLNCFSLSEYATHAGHFIFMENLVGRKLEPQKKQNFSNYIRIFLFTC